MPSRPSWTSIAGATRIGTPPAPPAMAGGVLTSVYMFPPRTNRTVTNRRPNRIMSGGLVGVTNLGRLSLTAGLTIILGHQGFMYLPRKVRFGGLLLTLSRDAKMYYNFFFDNGQEEMRMRLNCRE